jgi:muramidase (phage lysozyme)
MFMAPAVAVPVHAVQTTLPRRNAKNAQMIEHIMKCIRHHESDTAGGYRAQNPISTASGAYQYLDGTWRAFSHQAGYAHSPRHAKNAPPWMQDAVTRWALWNGHAKSWHGTWCPWT